MTDAYPPPLDDAALAGTWDAAWSSLGRPAPAGLKAELMAAWSEPHRHYHDQRHLSECLALWTHWRHHCERPAEVAVALWFHDAVHDPQASGNELGSAAWAARALIGAGLSSETAQRVFDLVMATRHDTWNGSQWQAQDAHLMADIDLSILGSPPDHFELYDQDVRTEYAWVRSFRYRALRTRVLQGFLDRPRVFHTESAVALFEAQARINLAAALSRLAQ